jgi:hypothetical protein
VELSIHYAVLSYCDDLTDPDATTRPVAMVGVGDDAFGFFIVRADPGDDLGGDSVSKSILNNLPSLLQRQLREGLHEVGPQRFLSWLHDRYRNSVSVSAIATETVSVPSSVDASLGDGTIFGPLLPLYKRVMLGLSPTTSPAKPRVVPPQYGVVPTGTWPHAHA